VPLTVPVIAETENEFPSDPLMTDVVATGEQIFVEQDITVTLPVGATIKRALLIGIITAMNDTANAQKIDLKVQGMKKSVGVWSTFFNITSVIGAGAVDGATTGQVAVQDVSSLVNAATVYGFRFTVNQTAAQSVRYTTQFLLVVTYALS
jgi:hypothetical protein